MGGLPFVFTPAHLDPQLKEREGYKICGDFVSLPGYNSLQLHTQPTIRQTFQHFQHKWEMFQSKCKALSQF